MQWKWSAIKISRLTAICHQIFHYIAASPSAIQLYNLGTEGLFRWQIHPNLPKTPHQTTQNPIFGIDFALILCCNSLRWFFILERWSSV